MTTRNDLARAAFHGNNNLLMDYLYDVDGYVWDGIAWQGNGMTLARAIEIMESLSDEQMAELEAVGIILVTVNVALSNIEELAEQPTDTLVVMEYTTTPRFRQIERHTAVAREDGSLVAVTGPAGDAESEAYARRFAASGDLLAACKATLEYWESDPAGFAACEPGCDCIVDQVRAAIASAEEAA